MVPEIFLTSFIATLFSMLNPIGCLGIFAGMTANHTLAESRKIAVTCAIAVAVILLIVAWCGSFFLEFFGISIASLRAAGGVIVLMIGLNMLFNNSEHKYSNPELADAKTRSSIAVVPLAIPIVAGPGAIASVLVVAHQHFSLVNRIEISLVILALSLFTGILFYYARTISQRIGPSGMGVITRIMGIVLAAIAMGLLADGLKALLPGLAG